MGNQEKKKYFKNKNFCVIQKIQTVKISQVKFIESIFKKELNDVH